MLQITGGAPLYDALVQQARNTPIAFHMPGHKRGKAFGSDNPLFSMDVTELSWSDNLHSPQGLIKEAQEAAARAFGAQETYFLVNGSSCGVMAMVTALCGPGDKLILDRNSHVSAIHALIACGAEPVWLYPPYDQEKGYTTGLTGEMVLEALAHNPDAKGVLLTSPNYYGETAELAAIASVVHNAGKYLLVDEAHGAHLAFSSLLPESALSCGADLVVQSAHKTLPALGQSAYLHVGKGRGLPRLRETLRLYQSTSPSYLLLGFLDYARFHMETKGQIQLATLVQNIRDIFHPLEENRDITRLVFPFENRSGYDAAAALEKEYGIVPEMADMKNVVCIATVADTKEDLERLQEAIVALGKREGKAPHARIRYGVGQGAAVSPRTAFFAPGEVIPLTKAEGRVAKTPVCMYPPGVPELVPGEIITKTNLSNLFTVSLNGGSVTGLVEGENVTVCAGGEFSCNCIQSDV